MENRMAVLAVIVRDSGSAAVISALAGKIGRLEGVTAKAVYAPQDGS